VVSGRNGNGNRFLTCEWVGMGMGMVLWEWEEIGTEIVLSAHLYLKLYGLKILFLKSYVIYYISFSVKLKAIYRDFHLHVIYNE